MSTLFDFDSVVKEASVAPIVIDTFAEKFMNGVKQSPQSIVLRFKQCDESLQGIVSFYYKDKEKNFKIEELVGCRYVNAIMMAMSGNYELMEKLDAEQNDIILTDEDNTTEDLVLAMYEEFLKSPLERLVRQPFKSPNGTTFFCIDFMLKHGKIAFCLPGYFDNYERYKDDRDRRREEQKAAA